MARTSKTVRLSDEIIEMIEAQAGENFTAKFEALVTRCVWELAGIQKQIEFERKQLKNLRDKSRDIRINANRIETLSSMAATQLNRCISELEQIKL